MNKKVLNMLVGVPGSGKSTFIHKNYGSDPTGWMVISSDNYIEKMAKAEGKTYAEVFTKYIKEAAKNVEAELAFAIQMGYNIIWDQTNLTAANRKKKLELIKDKGYELIATVFNVPHDLEARLASRPGKSIPKEVVKQMISQFEVPSKSEGFSKIVFV